jgi:hypothetical protein
MSLIPFHRGLIATAILFCLGYAGWEFVAYIRSGSAASLAVALLFLMLGAGLLYYLSRLSRFLGLPTRGGREFGDG